MASTFHKKVVLTQYNTLSRHVLVDEYYEHSGYLNLGLWRNGNTSQAKACETMVDTLAERLTKRGSVLDVACGNGATTKRLTQWWPGEKITGININDVQLDWGRRIAPECNFRNMSATELDYPDNSIDDILCIEAAFHFNTRKDFMEEAFRVLAPGGRIALGDIIIPRWAALLAFKIPAANYLKDIDAYRRLMEEAGFRNVQIEDATEDVWQPFLDNLFPFLKEAGADGRLKPYERVFINSFWFLQSRGLKNFLLISAEKPE